MMATVLVPGVVGSDGAVGDLVAHAAAASATRSMRGGMPSDLSFARSHSGSGRFSHSRGLIPAVRKRPDPERGYFLARADCWA